ncbi:MAG: hypothetical protein NC121_12685 [Blautia sp.]|nr:hypothetical protein [Blautia sp.]
MKKFGKGKLELSKKQEILLVLFLLAIGIFIRAFHFGMSPVGVHQDEAMIAVDALALSEHGTDRYGMRLPVHFTAWVGGQQSVLLAYCMVPLIKLFGFSTVTVRFPMLAVSGLGLLALYFLGKHLGSVRMGLLLMIMGIICPWHYMQSRWSFDCNMFPHMFLFGVCFLLAGLKKKWMLYVSMVFFALCCYSYGVADYSVPLFLLAAAIYLWKRKMIRIKELAVCFCVFTALALPEYLSMLLTVLGRESMETPLFTIPSFPLSFRGNDILLTNFSWGQLWRNIVSTVTVVWGSGDKSATNTIVRFGPVYYLTVAFFCIGLAVMAVRLFGKRKQEWAEEKSAHVILLLWLFMGIWVGVITREVTINRINVIFYAVLAIAAVGIQWCLDKCVWSILPVGAYYGISALLFAAAYFGAWTDISRIYYYDSYVQALEYAETLECDIYYITPDPQGEGVNAVGEILTMYCHEIDALYYQGVSNVQDGRERLPYQERYRFTDVTEDILAENAGKPVVYMINGDSRPLFDEGRYDIASFYDDYFVIVEK